MFHFSIKIQSNKIYKITNCFLLAFILYFLNSAFSLKTAADTVPPIIGPWTYSVDRCDGWIGAWSSESEAAQMGAQAIFGSTAVIVKTSGWGTLTSPQPGPCGSDNLYPVLNKMKLEDYNYNGYTIKYSGVLLDGMTMRRTRPITCPTGTTNTQYACVINNIGSYLSPDNSPSSCPKNPTAGNPVFIGNGSKLETTESIGSGNLKFNFTYNNLDRLSSTPWHHNLQQSLRVTDPSSSSYVKAKSKLYGSRQDACVSGWNEMKASITDAWSIGATARLNGISCEIVNNGKVVNHLLFYIPQLPVPGSVQLFRGDGSVVSYEYYDGTSFRSVSGEHGLLQQTSTGEWDYSSQEGIAEHYNQAGQLISIVQNGQKQTFTYNQTTGDLDQASDSLGHTLLFSYTNHVLMSVTQDNNKITKYTYTANGLIEKIIHPDNTFRQFYYEDSRFPSFLTGVTDERNIRYATWKYDAQGRAISSEHSSGNDKVAFLFNADGSTTVTNALNKQTIYRFDYIAGARNVVAVEGQPTTNCAGANQNYTYTPEGWLASKTDWSGNKTTYAYNPKGQEVSRVEAFGTPVAKTITTEWHTAFNLKTKVTEPDRETTYNYEANGLLIGQKTRSLVAQ